MVKELFLILATGCAVALSGDVGECLLSDMIKQSCTGLCYIEKYDYGPDSFDMYGCGDLGDYSPGFQLTTFSPGILRRATYVFEKGQVNNYPPGFPKACYYGNDTIETVTHCNPSENGYSACYVRKNLTSGTAIAYGCKRSDQPIKEGCQPAGDDGTQDCYSLGIISNNETWLATPRITECWVGNERYMVKENCTGVCYIVKYDYGGNRNADDEFGCIYGGYSPGFGLVKYSRGIQRAAYYFFGKGKVNNYLPGFPKACYKGDSMIETATLCDPPENGHSACFVRKNLTSAIAYGCKKSDQPFKEGCQPAGDDGTQYCYSLGIISNNETWLNAPTISGV